MENIVCDFLALNSRSKSIRHGCKRIHKLISQILLYFSINFQERDMVFSKAPSSYSFWAPTMYFSASLAAVSFGRQETNQSIRTALKS